MNCTENNRKQALFLGQDVMTLTTEIIKWFMKAKVMIHYLCRHLILNKNATDATAFVLSGLMLKEYVSQKLKFSLFNPHHAITILSYVFYCIFLSMVYYLRLHPCLFSPLVYLTISSARMCGFFISLKHFVVCWTFRFYQEIHFPLQKNYNNNLNCIM